MEVLQQHNIPYIPIYTIYKFLCSSEISVTCTSPVEKSVCAYSRAPPHWSGGLCCHQSTKTMPQSLWACSEIPERDQTGCTRFMTSPFPTYPIQTKPVLSQATVKTVPWLPRNQCTEKITVVVFSFCTDECRFHPLASLSVCLWIVHYFCLVSSLGWVFLLTLAITPTVPNKANMCVGTSEFFCEIQYFKLETNCGSSLSSNKKESPPLKKT